MWTYSINNTTYTDANYIMHDIKDIPKLTNETCRLDFIESVNER